MEDETSAVLDRIFATLDSFKACSFDIRRECSEALRASDEVVQRLQTAIDKAKLRGALWRHGCEEMIPTLALQKILPDHMLHAPGFACDNDISTPALLSWLFDDSEKLLPPLGIAEPCEVTEEMRVRQKLAPTEWALELRHFFDIIDHCTQQPQYKRIKAAKGFVSMYDINELFVKSWTAGTGCSLAVLMSKTTARAARMMLSHAWAEDAEELKQAVKAHTDRHEIPDSTPVWFCVFSNYQAEDGKGPSIKEQIALNPFAQVIESEELKTRSGGHGMLSVHTTQADLYSRLWCAHEVDRAINQEDLKVAAAMSNQYIADLVRRADLFLEMGVKFEEWQDAAGINVSTIKAKCSSFDDERMLVGQIMMQDGAFARLDTVIRRFRGDWLPREVWLTAARKGSINLKVAPVPIQADYETVLAAVQQEPGALEHAAEELKKNKNIVLAAVQLKGDTLRYAAGELRRDREIVLAAVQQQGEALKYAAEELQRDKPIVIAALRQNPDAIKYVAEELRTEQEFLLAASHANFQHAAVLQELKLKQKFKAAAVDCAEIEAWGSAQAES
eukprot:gnl/TRDRNA2_/TRDRNA2_93111_c0_seq1.p1 gnl/TRDRNA2_/TRDRNA2_93111_c0~~gnl/TRDRNA2_/TRDRNA2_93111_c0_seq1.p1  ORF type:complete len:560 (-),score=126.87 gnl/TRDRNA2_/TRDRNA2_93111_c0_seq1:185-1864(-)